MASPSYLDFELLITKKKGQEYEARVVRSPLGQATHTFRLPFTRDKLEIFVLKLGTARQGIRHIISPQVELEQKKLAQVFGGHLFRAVFAGEVGDRYVGSHAAARSQGLGLRLKLWLDAPELINIPWEYLFDASIARHLALVETTPVMRYVDMGEGDQPLAVRPPLSILVMVSSPANYPRLDVAAERAKLDKALGKLAAGGQVVTEWVEPATLPSLDETLVRGQYHILHFIGHGGLRRTGEGVLILQDEDGRGQEVGAESLAYLLLNHPALKLVVLNACEGARTSPQDPFAGVAMTLLRTGGKPAVVAMQFAITDRAAITFTRGFYTALALGYPVDAAVTRARLAIFATGNEVEWGTPVLYMRAPDGRIFDVPAAGRLDAEAVPVEDETRAQRERQASARQAEARRQAQIATTLAAADEHLKAGRLPEAIAGFEAVLSLDPAHAEAHRRLAEAQAEQERRAGESARRDEEERKRREEEARQVELARLYAAAGEAAQAGRWSAAVEGFRAVLVLDTGYRDATARLAQAQDALDREEALRRDQERLLSVLRDPGRPAKERAEAGNDLARLGDPRAAVISAEEIEFCQVPAGPFVMGSRDYSGAFEDEQPQHTLSLAYDYWMSRYPATHAQFRAFVEAGGYQERRYWREADAAKRWRSGKVKRTIYDFKAGKWVTVGEEEADSPYDFGEPYTLANYPVVGVTWYEALAFTRWLTDRLLGLGGLPQGWEVRLPSEAEWEKAARGGVEVPASPVIAIARSGLTCAPASVRGDANPNAARRYPWGNEADPNRANYSDTGIGATSAVGCFPGGASPYGVEEMGGNVWEWTRSLWGKDSQKPSFKYSYKPGDGRENLAAPPEVRRVLRGGRVLQLR